MREGLEIHDMFTEAMGEAIADAGAGNYQLPGAENLITFNVGGSTTTCVSFVVGVGK